MKCNFFSSSIARKITTTLEEGNPHLRKDGAMVPIQQWKEDLTQILLKVTITAGSGATSPGIAKVLKP